MENMLYYHGEFILHNPNRDVVKEYVNLTASTYNTTDVEDTTDKLLAMLEKFNNAYEAAHKEEDYSGQLHAVYQMVNIFLSSGCRMEAVTDVARAYYGISM